MREPALARSGLSATIRARAASLFIRSFRRLPGRLAESHNFFCWRTFVNSGRLRKFRMDKKVLAARPARRMPVPTPIPDLRRAECPQGQSPPLAWSSCVGLLQSRFVDNAPWTTRLRCRVKAHPDSVSDLAEAGSLRKCRSRTASVTPSATRSISLVPDGNSKLAIVGIIAGARGVTPTGDQRASPLR